MILVRDDGELVEIGDTIYDSLGDGHTYLMVLPSKRIITIYNGVTCRYWNKSFPKYLVVDNDQ